KRFQLEKGTIKGLRMTGFDLLNRTGKIEVLREINIEKLKATIGEEGKGAVQKGTISFRAHGQESDVEAMRGGELSAELRTDGMTLQIGTVEKIVATDVTGRVAATSLESGKVTTGPIEITDSKVSIPDIKIASLDAVAPAYKDDKGTEVKLAKAKITGITL